jgi:hypothetical protein
VAEFRLSQPAARRPRRQSLQNLSPLIVLLRVLRALGKVSIVPNFKSVSVMTLWKATNEVLTVKEVSELLHIHHSTVYRMIQGG